MISTQQSQPSNLSAQQRLSLARRRIFHEKTVAKFENFFQYPLWESEKEHLAHLLQLKVERLTQNEAAVQDGLLSGQRAKGLGRLRQNYPPNGRKVRAELEMEAAKQVGGNTREHKRVGVEEKEDSEEDNIEDRETEKALQWLAAEWASLLKDLRELDSEISWDEDY